MKKALISLTIIMLALTALNIQAAGGRQGQGGGQGQGRGQGQGGGSGEMRRDRSQIHQQESGQYQQGYLQQQEEINQNQILQPVPATGVVSDQQ